MDSSYLLVAGDVEVGSQWHYLGRVLSLPVLPELVASKVRTTLDVGDHLEEAGVGVARSKRRSNQSRENGDGGCETNHCVWLDSVCAR